MKHTMGMAVTGHYYRLLACSVAHPAKSATRVFARNIVGVSDVESLLQIHACTECLLTGAGEHSTPEFWFGIVPFPQCSQLNRRFYREAVHVFRPVDRDQKNMLLWKRDDAVLDVRIRGFNPFWCRVFRSGSCHGRGCCSCVFKKFTVGEIEEACLLRNYFDTFVVLLSRSFRDSEW